MLESLRLRGRRDTGPRKPPVHESAVQEAPEKTEPGLSLDRIGDDALCSIIFAFATRPMYAATAPDVIPSLPPLSRGLNEYVQAEAPAIKSGAETIRGRSVDLLRWTTTDAEARAALGLNTWEGVEYFNKEKMEAMLELVPSFAMIEKRLKTVGAGESAGTKSPERKVSEPTRRKNREAVGARLQELTDDEDLAVFAMCDTIRALEEPCEFRMDRLISLVAGKSDK